MFKDRFDAFPTIILYDSVLPFLSINMKSTKTFTHARQSATPLLPIKTKSEKKAFFSEATCYSFIPCKCCFVDCFGLYFVIPPINYINNEGSFSLGADFWKSMIFSSEIFGGLYKLKPKDKSINLFVNESLPPILFRVKLYPIKTVIFFSLSTISQHLNQVNQAECLI